MKRSLSTLFAVVLLLLSSAGDCLDWRRHHYQFEPETLTYLSLSGVSLTLSQQGAIDANVKAAKYGSGATLAAFTGNLSTINGAAFISTPSVDLRAYLGMKIALSDGAQSLVGWIKTAGTGETLGDELVSGWTNSATHPYETLTTDGSDITQAANTVGSGVCYSAAAATAGWLIKVGHTYTKASGTSPVLRIASSAALGSPILGIALSGGTVAYYRTAEANYSHIGYYLASGAVDFSVSDFSFKRVLTPSATGVTIVSTQGGATYNWTSDGGIDPNAASFTATITRE